MYSVQKPVCRSPKRIAQPERLPVDGCADLPSPQFRCVETS